MKKLAILLALLLCCLGLWVPAGAASNASSVHSQILLQENGIAQVQTTIQLHLETAPTELVFPLPAKAENILLNGGTVQTEQTEGALKVKLPGISAGNYSFRLTYDLPGVITKENKAYHLKLTLLEGFAYPIGTMSFAVTLPGNIQAEPVFYSGYHQAGIESLLDVSISGSTLSGTTTQGLKDHEVLTLTLPVDIGLFPAMTYRAPILSRWDAAALVCVALAIVYYCICLLPVIPRRVRCITAPESMTAGEVGCCLTGCGPDLSMMVLTWAQLGYIRIELNRSQVLLHKRMDMGNERSSFEMRVFQNLFRTRHCVSGTGHHYARLYRKVAAKSPLLHQLFLPSSGNPRIFRILIGIAGAISGVNLALSLPVDSSVHTMLGILFAVFCAAFSFFLQSAGKCLPLRDKSPLFIGLGCGLLWIALGVLLDRWALVTPMVLLQFASGVAAAYGGRRSERGKRCLAELTSLRSFLVSAPAEELQQMLQRNPNYFYELAPFALAMGVDKGFAKRFGKTPLPDCSFLDLGQPREMTAWELAQLLRQTADRLNALQKRLPYERLTGK